MSGRTGRLLARFVLESMLKDKEFIESIKNNLTSSEKGGGVSAGE